MARQLAAQALGVPRDGDAGRAAQRALEVTQAASGKPGQALHRFARTVTLPAGRRGAGPGRAAAGAEPIRTRSFAIPKTVIPAQA